ncbi:hypothetical protein ABGB18_06460 [Nonomuraea sp. B12E4]
MTAQNDDGEDATNRRRLLRLAASAGVLGYGESVRQVLDLATEMRRSVEEWHITAADHLHALRTRPPAQVVTDLVIDAHALAEQMSTAAARELPELHRVAAMLSSVQANALTREGDHGAAIRWWRTARRSADASRDLDLRLLVRAEEAAHGLYGQRSPESVLRLIEDARRLAGQRPVLKLLTAEAKALSMIGRHDEATESLYALLALTEVAEGDRLGFWKTDQIYFAASWVHAAAGREDLADQAYEQVLRLAGDYLYPVNVNLHRAMCTVRLGGVDEGVRRAADVVDALPVRYRSTHVMETARMVLRAVPIENQTRPVARDLRAMLTIEA